MRDLSKHKNWRYRLEWYRLTNNWTKAEDDKDVDIRREAYKYTENWAKAEDDRYWIVRLEAYRHTGNWSKALNDAEPYVRNAARVALEAQALIQDTVELSLEDIAKEFNIDVDKLRIKD